MQQVLILESDRNLKGLLVQIQNLRFSPKMNASHASILCDYLSNGSVLAYNCSRSDHTGTCACLSETKIWSDNSTCSLIRRDMYMPIAYRIDSALKVVFAKAKGRLTDEEVFGYQQQVWSDPMVAGF